MSAACGAGHAPDRRGRGDGHGQDDRASHPRRPDGRKLAEQDPETGRFFIGVKMLSWATAARDRFSLVRLVEPRWCASRANPGHDLSGGALRRRHRVPRLPRGIVPDQGAHAERRRPAAARDRRRQHRDPGGASRCRGRPHLRGHADIRAPTRSTRCGCAACRPPRGRTATPTTTSTCCRGWRASPGWRASACQSARDGMPVAALLTSVTSRLDRPRRDTLVASMHQEAARSKRSSSPCWDPPACPSAPGPPAPRPEPPAIQAGARGAQRRRRHLHRPDLSRSDERRDPPGQGADDHAQPGRGCARCDRAGGAEPGAGEPDRARHDGDHQCPAGTQACALRARHHARLPRHADRPAHAADPTA